MRPTDRACFIAAAVFLGACSCVAQTAPQSPTESAQDARTAPDIAPTADKDTPEDFSRLAAQANDAYKQGDYEASERLLRRQLALQDENAAVWYNLACCLGQQKRTQDAFEALRTAIERGFSDRARIGREPALFAVVNTDRFKALTKEWEQVLAEQATRLVKATRDEFSQGISAVELKEIRDEQLRVIFLYAVDARLVDRAREELRAVQRWADAAFFAPRTDDAPREPPPWIVVILPQRDAFEAWAQRTYGEQARGSFNQIGGTYEHSRKRLVALDLGPTLRHEFFHTLHYRWMEQRSQELVAAARMTPDIQSPTVIPSPPIWIMEGLASLVEDVEISPEGTLTLMPSWRTNIAQRMEKAGSLPGLAELAAMSQLRFTSSRPLAHYAVARSVFLFLEQTRNLDDKAPNDSALVRWWRTYSHQGGNGMFSDPSGVRALESALNRPVRTGDKDFRLWLRTLPPVAETIEPGMASLGIEVDAGKGEGPVVASSLRSSLRDRTKTSLRDKVQTKDADAQNAKPGHEVLRSGDLILAIDSRPTRDIAELIRVLGSCQPEQVVTVEVRRGAGVQTFSVRLVAKR
jgi:hypothetical protein